MILCIKALSQAVYRVYFLLHWKSHFTPLLVMRLAVHGSWTFKDISSMEIHTLGNPEHCFLWISHYLQFPHLKSLSVFYISGHRLPDVNQNQRFHECNLYFTINRCHVTRWISHDLCVYISQSAAWFSDDNTSVRGLLFDLCVHDISNICHYQVIHIVALEL